MIRTKDPRQNPLIGLRARKVHRLMTLVRSRVTVRLRSFVNESARRVLDGAGPLPVDYQTRWSGELFKTERPLQYTTAGVGRDQAKTELENQVKRRVDNDIVRVGEQAENFLTDDLATRVDGWLEGVASSTTRRLADKIEDTHKKAREFRDEYGNAMSLRDLAREIAALNVSYTPNRARMIAVTDTNYSFNAGARDMYVTSGITVLEWMTTRDDAVCPFCAQMDGVRIRSDKDFFNAGDRFRVEVQEGEFKDLPIGFPVSNPPLHPFCGCTILPVLESAGVVVQVDEPETVTIPNPIGQRRLITPVMFKHRNPNLPGRRAA